jgi:hypothetical protein
MVLAQMMPGRGAASTEQWSSRQHHQASSCPPCRPPAFLQVRRRAVVPAFHKQYYEAMNLMFGRCTQVTIDKLAAACAAGPSGAATADMETEFLNLGLEIIGLGVFNYGFGSITSESPVIKAVYGVLKEAEHRCVGCVVGGGCSVRCAVRACGWGLGVCGLWGLWAVCGAWRVV